MAKLAQRATKGKAQWDLIPLDVLEPVVRAMMNGAEKYAPHDWQKGQKFSTIFNSLMRHLVDLQAGKDIDEDSGLPVIGHVGANVVIMSWMLKYRPDLDDRRKTHETTARSRHPHRRPRRAR